MSVGATSLAVFIRMTLRSRFGASSLEREMTRIPSSSPTHESSITTSGSKDLIFSTASSTVLARRTLWSLSTRMSLMISWTASLSSTIRIFIQPQLHQVIRLEPYNISDSLKFADLGSGVHSRSWSE